MRWRKLVEQQRASGLSVSVFSRQHGIAASSLFAWRRRLARGAEVFTPVKVVGGSKLHSASEGGDAAIELRLPGRRRLMVRRGFDRQLLLDLLGALEAKPSMPESRT